MITNNFYFDRILSMANKKKLFDKRCDKFENIPIDFKEYIKKILPEIVMPILVFHYDYNHSMWTILTTTKIISYYDNNLSISNLNEIKFDIYTYIEKDITSTETLNKKELVKWIFLRETNHFIWTPSSSELYDLWGILLNLSKMIKRKK